MNSLPKLIITLGPESDNKETIELMQKKGADCFRINLSHSKEKDLDRYFEIFKNLDINPCLDTQGAQLRCSCIHKNTINIGEKVYIHDENLTHQFINTENHIFINHWQECKKEVKVGMKFRIDIDGLVIKVKKINLNSINCIAISSGNILDNRGLDIIDSEIKLSSITKFDRIALKHKICQKSGIIFMSFVNCAEDIRNLRKTYSGSIAIIAKIETKKGIENFKEICHEADGVLVDRGDLSREISISNIPIVVNSLVSKANEYRKPIYIATNVLDSMMSSSLPSRAEISDIYNLLDRGVKGLVLAGETAIGKNPVQSVAVLKFMQIKFENKNLNEETSKKIRNDLFNKYKHLSYWL